MQGGVLDSIKDKISDVADKVDDVKDSAVDKVGDVANTVTGGDDDKRKEEEEEKKKDEDDEGELISRKVGFQNALEALLRINANTTSTTIV